MPEHTCSPAQSREGSAASRLLLLILPVQTQPIFRGFSVRRIQRGSAGSDLPPGTEAGTLSRQSGEDPTTPTPSGEGWVWLKGEGGAPSDSNSNRSCTNGSLITINYHFRLAEPPLCLFCSPPFIRPRTFPRTKGRKRRITNGATNPPAFGGTIWQRGYINYPGF